MKLTRDLKELFELILENKEDFKTGLCLWVGTMYRNNKICVFEEDLLSEYIHNNRPKNLRLFLLGKNYQGFYWKSGKIEPRIKWIQKQIKKLEKNDQTATTIDF